MAQLVTRALESAGLNRIFGALLAAGALLSLIVLGPASARTYEVSRYGGTLVVGLATGDPDTLDPTLSRSLSAAEILTSWCERLYEFDSRSRIVPELAAALPVISKDKLTYTIPLRQGVEFNDGTAFNAPAVAASIERMINLPGSARASDFTSVDTVTATGPSTVVIHLRQRFTPLTAALATTDGCVMSPTQIAKLGANFGSDPVGVGPFMFDHRDVGVDVTLIKSPYYYNQGAVHLDKIVYEPEPDAAAAAAALKAGDLQALDLVASPELPEVRETGSVRLLARTLFGWLGLFVNLGNRSGIGNLPYANVGTALARSPNLRRAFEEAINRKTLVDVVFGGAAIPGCTPTSPASPTYDATVECTPYDPKGAKELVAQSGIPNPAVHLLTPAVGDLPRLAQFIQAEEAAVGIGVVIDTTDTATALALAGGGNFDTLLISVSGNPDADSIMYDYFATSGSRNYSGYSNPQLDLILANSRRATSPEALKTLYRVAAQILVNDRPIVVLDHQIRYAGVTTSVAGVRQDDAGFLRVAFARYR